MWQSGEFCVHDNRHNRLLYPLRMVQGKNLVVHHKFSLEDCSTPNLHFRQFVSIKMWLHSHIAQTVGMTTLQKTHLHDYNMRMRKVEVLSSS